MVAEKDFADQKNHPFVAAAIGTIEQNKAPKISLAQDLHHTLEFIPGKTLYHVDGYSMASQPSPSTA